MTYSYAQWRQLSREALIDEFDRLAANTQHGLAFLAEELVRRDMQEQNGRIEAMTKHIRGLTIIIAILTVVSTVAVVWSLIR
jgi:hypothetical protein